MQRVHWYPLVLMLLLPTESSALQLRWSTGTTDLTFTAATRCTLVVQADSAEAVLPGEWRLLWLADSSGVNFVAADSSAACQVTTAQVSAIEPPATAADSAANQITAHFCSSGENWATEARWILDQPGGSAGRLEVVALDPSDPDSNRVLVSNEVTYNGGVGGTFPPVVLRAGRYHPTADLTVEAIGIGFADAPRVEIVAPDTSWRLALKVEERSNSRIKAVARVAADLPPFVVSVGRTSGKLGVASLPADTASSLLIQPACTNEMLEINLVRHEDIQPKDFAMVASRDSFHVFYTRQDYYLPFAQTSKIIGHKRSRDLYNWDPDEHTMYAVQAGNGGAWDANHVWAPTIIKKPGDITYYMLYTGVDASGVQRLGVATSTDLNVWTQDSNAAYESGDVSWALSGTPEFRDPFVMADPDSAGRYLLYFVTKSQERGRYVVGVARTNALDPANLRDWKDPQPLWNTDSLHTNEAVIESPHAFKDPDDRWWLFFTGYNSGSDPGYVSFETNDVSPADLDTTRWSAPDTLFAMFGGDQKLQYWHASEYYRWAPGYEYLMAFNDAEHSVDVSQISWHNPHTFVLTDSCPPRARLDVLGPPRAMGVGLDIVGAHPARAPVAFLIHIPQRMRVELAIFDLAGRRVRTLLDGEHLAGDAEVRWDGLGAHGEVPRFGVYFARLSAEGGQRVAKLVLLK